jgi:acetyl-CoA C-acetyltransferase
VSNAGLVRIEAGQETCTGWAAPRGIVELRESQTVARQAIEDAGVAPEDVDGIFLGTFNGGFVPQDFPASLVLQHLPELRFRPVTRYENACATGSAAIHGALDFIKAGRGRVTLVIGGCGCRRLRRGRLIHAMVR